MAITLQLTDGTTTVDFNDGSTLYLASAFQMNVFNGIGNELIIAAWVGTTTADTKSTTMRAANKLFRQAQRSARLNDISQWVWLAWKPDDQTNTQYARVLGGGFAEITDDVIGARGSGVWTVDVLRQGDWWDREPDDAYGASRGYLTTASGTVYNKSDADGDNWLSFTARDGDLPSLLEINIAPIDRDTSAVVVATKDFDDATQADLFNPHFNGADRFSGGSLAAETAAPDDFKVNVTTTTTVTWQIAAANLEAYFGRYRVWARTRRTAGSTGDFLVAIKTPSRTNANVDPGAGGGMQDLGTIEIPGTDRFQLLGTETVYTLSLVCTCAGSGTGEIYGFWLVPMDNEIIRVQIPDDFTVADNRLNINGAYELCYVEEPDLGATPTYEVDYSKPVEVSGQFPKLATGRYNRAYFWFEWNYSSTWPAGYNYNDTYTVTISAIDRYSSLRGST